MKLAKKVFSMLLAATICVTLSGVPVLAAETATTDEIEVTLTTDKTEYTADETVSVNVTIKNLTDKALNNISIKADIPEGIKVSEGSLSTQTIASLEANGSVEYKTTLQKSSSTSLPKMGDSASVLVFSIIIIGAGLGIIAFGIRRRKANSFFALLLAITLFGSLFAVRFDDVHAASSATVDKEITVAGQKYTIGVNVVVAGNAQIENGGFETGDLTGWTTLNDNWGKTEDGKFTGVINATTYWAEELPYNQSDEYHLDGWNIQDTSDGKIGEADSWGVRSSAFTLSGSGYISVKMGGNAAAVKVFLKDGTLVGYYKQNRFSDTNFPHVGQGGSWADMGTYVMDLSSYVGKDMYIELWDETIDGGWAVAFFDDVVTYYEAAPNYASMYDTVLDGHTGDETATEIKIPWTLLNNQK